MSRMLALASLMAVLGCGDEEASPEQEMPGAATTDAQVGTTPDGGAGPSAAIPLVLWVDDLLDHHTDEASLPDTVHDKNIVDDENPATFDLRFRR